MFIVMDCLFQARLKILQVDFYYVRKTIVDQQAKKKCLIHVIIVNGSKHVQPPQSVIQK